MNNVFHTYHPAVAFAFLACAIALSMAAMHPVYVCLSLAGSFACSAVARGMRQTVLALRWVVPLCLVVAVANPLFSASGSTELFLIGLRAIYLESLAYGLCAGGMFASVFLWFASYAACMTSENSMALLGNVAPTVSFMISQVLRLLPQFLARGRTIMQVQDAVSAAAPHGKKDAASARMRVVNVLMGWGMEDGLERSDAMRARGYGCGIRRTTYRRFKVRRADAALIGAILALALVSAVSLYATVSVYDFYPVMSPLAPSWGYGCYGAFMLIPVVLQAKEWWLWHWCK